MLSSFPVSVLIGTLLGFLSGLGVGGGSLLILWLTLVLNLPQESARAINLLFFLPAAVIACLFRWKQGSIPFRKILPAIIAGCVSTVLFNRIRPGINSVYLKKAFGLLLLLTGFRELTYRQKK